MFRPLDVATSFATTLMRLPLGYTVGKIGKRPKKMLELYEFEACPYCRKVREALSMLDLEAKTRGTAVHEILGLPPPAPIPILYTLPIRSPSETERLARYCEEIGQWNFLLTVAPLKAKGATGSPVNPIAMF